MTAHNQWHVVTPPGRTDELVRVLRPKQLASSAECLAGATLEELRHLEAQLKRQLVVVRALIEAEEKK